jgi:16S rRNA (uracil1498-N3)-methyltransferase
VSAHVFVEDVDHPLLTPEDRHHLERVLRVPFGDEVTVSDGRGLRRRCRFGPELEPLGDSITEAAPTPQLTVAFALVKGRRPELVVQKLTELGVDVIVPFLADRSVVRWDEARAEHHHGRLLRVAREAAMQSQRRWLPEVAPVATFDAAVELPGAALASPGGEPLSLATPAVLVGPEGGWSDVERSTGLPTVGLGPTVLRAETAAIAVGVLLTALRADVVGAGSSAGPA